MKRIFSAFRMGSPGRNSIKHWMALSYALLKKKVNYVLDADNPRIFSITRQELLIQFVEHRVADPRHLR